MPKSPVTRARSQVARDRELERVVRRTLDHASRALYRDAALYDQFYRRRSTDVRFYVEIAKEYAGPVLELGAGTGRVSCALARAGVEVLGIDSMPEMLARARERVAKLPARVRARVQLRRGDMRSLALARRFPLVIAPFNAFAHLYSLRDLERALEVCRNHLAPRGRLVFDVMLPDLRALLQDPERSYRGRDLVDPRDGERRIYHEASHYDPLRQIRSVTMLLASKDEARAPRAIPLAQRQFFPTELAAILHYNGFRIEQHYGDFERSALHVRSETQAVIASVRERHADRARPRR